MPAQMYGAGANKKWTVVRNTAEARKFLLTGRVTHISLDNDLGTGQEEGHKLLYWMIENDVWPTEEVYVHSANIVRAPQMREDVERWYYIAKSKSS